MSWKEKVEGYQAKKFIEHEIPDAGTIRFYPNRIGSLAHLRELQDEIATVIGHFFTNTENDCGSAVKRYKEGAATVEETCIVPATPDVLEFRAKERRQAIGKLFDLLDSRNLLYFGQLLMDSMREEFPYKRDRDPQEIEEFLYGKDGKSAVDFELFFHLVVGWLRGNARQFGDAGKKLVALLQNQVQNLLKESTQEQGEETSGSNSKTPSSPQSDGDSPSTT